MVVVGKRGKKLHISNMQIGNFLPYVSYILVVVFSFFGHLALTQTHSASYERFGTFAEAVGKDGVQRQYEIISKDEAILLYLNHSRGEGRLVFSKLAIFYEITKVHPNSSQTIYETDLNDTFYILNDFPFDVFLTDEGGLVFLIKDSVTDEVEVSKAMKNFRSQFRDAGR